MTDEQIRDAKTKQYAAEFKEAAFEVMFNAPKLKDPQGN